MSRQMKDSGEVWMRNIPSVWPIYKLKYAAPIQTERAENNVGYVGLENIESWTGRLIETDSESSGESVAFQKGDVMFGKLRPYLAKSFCAKESGCGSTELLVMRPTKRLYPRYLEFITHSMPFVNRIDVSTYGAKMPRANADFIGNLLIPCPDIQEQSAIVAYLDSRCAKIDEAISRHKQIIEKLEEYRKSVITQAVTKGLDPNVEMKDSGIEGIGFVLSDSLIVRAKYISEIQTGPFGTQLSAEEYVPSGYPCINVKNIGIGCIKYDDVDYISDETRNRLSSHILKEGDIIFARKGSIDKHAIIRDIDAGAIQGSDCIRMRLKAGILPEYVNYYLAYAGIEYYLRGVANGSTMASLNSDMIKALPIVLPNESVQRKIVKALDEICGKVSSACSRHIKAIEKLEEYRKSIIYNAVTGKIDCRSQKGIDHDE